MTDSQSYPVTTPLRERIALILLSRRGFGFYLDPMEGGQDAYDLTMEALDEADAIISVLPDGVAQTAVGTVTAKQFWEALKERCGSTPDKSKIKALVMVRFEDVVAALASPVSSTDREAGK